MAQIAGHAGKSADLEQELSGVKEQFAAAEAKAATEVAAMMAQITEHAGKSADLEQELSGVKE